MHEWGPYINDGSLETIILVTYRYSRFVVSSMTLKEGQMLSSLVHFENYTEQNCASHNFQRSSTIDVS